MGVLCKPFLCGTRQIPASFTIHCSIPLDSSEKCLLTLLYYSRLKMLSQYWWYLPRVGQGRLSISAPWRVTWCVRDRRWSRGRASIWPGGLPAPSSVLRTLDTSVSPRKHSLAENPFCFYWLFWVGFKAVEQCSITVRLQFFLGEKDSGI